MCTSGRGERVSILVYRVGESRGAGLIWGCAGAARARRVPAGYWVGCARTGYEALRRAGLAIDVRGVQSWSARARGQTTWRIEETPHDRAGRVVGFEFTSACAFSSVLALQAGDKAWCWRLRSLSRSSGLACLALTGNIGCVRRQELVKILFCSLRSAHRGPGRRRRQMVELGRGWKQIDYTGDHVTPSSGYSPLPSLQLYTKIFMSRSVIIR